MRRERKCLSIMLLMVAIVAAHSVAAEAKVIGTVGATYPFAERDGLSEIEAKARLVDWKKSMDKLKKQGEGYFPSSVPRLPVAVAWKKKLVDPTFVLDQDIPDPRKPGSVLYPRGYKFNPLNYAPFPGEVVVVNAADRRQLEWLAQSPYMKQLSSVILLTGGDISAISTAAGRTVYYADRKLTGRLGVKAVPSVVRQRGNMYEVEEVDVRIQKKRTVR